MKSHGDGKMTPFDVTRAWYVLRKLVDEAVRTQSNQYIRNGGVSGQAFRTDRGMWTVQVDVTHAESIEFTGDDVAEAAAMVWWELCSRMTALNPEDLSQ